MFIKKFPTRYSKFLFVYYNQCKHSIQIQIGAKIFWCIFGCLAVSWTVLTCVFKCPFWPNFLLQIKQVNGFAFSWTVLTCWFKCPLCPYDLLQIKHLNGFGFSWTFLLCLFKFPFCPNDFLQIKQANGFAFSWTIFTCIFNCPLCPKFFLQIRHWIWLALFITISMWDEL